METIPEEVVEEARRLAKLIPDFESWKTQDARSLPEEVQLVDTVLFYVWHCVNEQRVELDELPEELVAFFQKNETLDWLNYVLNVA